MEAGLQDVNGNSGDESGATTGKADPVHDAREPFMALPGCAYYLPVACTILICCLPGGIAEILMVADDSGVIKLLDRKGEYRSRDGC